MADLFTGTAVYVILFATGYLYMLIRKAASNRIDIYDLFMLSMVAIVPSVVAILPQYSAMLARAIGVEFPFVVMFGLLFIIVFVLLHRVIIIIHKLKLQMSKLVQEVGVLDAKCRKLETRN